MGRFVLLLCIPVVVSPPGVAPVARGRVAEDPRPAPVGAWHLAVELRAGGTSGADLAAILDQARAELSIGSLDRARDLLRCAGRLAPLDPAAWRLRALVERAAGDHVAAGRLYAAAAARAGGARRGVLEARAGEAFDQAGLKRLAREHYRRAARLLPQAAGWLAVREARLQEDTAIVARLLMRAGPAERRRAADVWAAALIRAGDSTGAVGFKVLAGRYADAAALSLALGDAVRGRRLLYRALRDAPAAVGAVERLLTTSPPLNADEVSAVAGALRRIGRAPEAVRVLRLAAARAVDVPVLLASADALMDARDRAGASVALERALRSEGRAGADGEYARARLRLRVRGEAAGLPALLAFARAYPSHPGVPSALYLVADSRERAGRRRMADSLYQVIATGWPTHGAATQAQLRLGVSAERARQFARARILYASVRDVGGPDAAAARFMLGRTALASGDSGAAAVEWEALAREDPLGYYGMAARQAAGLPKLTIAAPAWAAAGEALRDIVSGLALLTALGVVAEADAQVTWAIEQLGSDPEQLLALGRHLLTAGWTETAVNIGWRASGRLGLDDPRVLRLVFPWPLRQAVRTEAHKFGLDPYLLAGLIRQESLFRSGVTSRAGARGLMQLMPATAAELARRLGVDWHDRLLGVADANLHLGAAHLASLVRRFRGNEVLALAAYNAGGRPVDQWRRRWAGITDRVQFVDHIPYPETRGYVRTVVRNRALYRALYPPSGEQ